MCSLAQVIENAKAWLNEPTSDNVEEPRGLQSLLNTSSEIPEAYIWRVSLTILFPGESA